MKTSILIAAITLISYSGIAQTVKTESKTSVSGEAGQNQTMQVNARQKSENQAYVKNNKIASDASINGSAAASGKPASKALKTSGNSVNSASENALHVAGSTRGAAKAGLRTASKSDIKTLQPKSVRVNTKTTMRSGLLLK